MQSDHPLGLTHTLRRKCQQAKFSLLINKLYKVCVCEEKLIKVTLRRFFSAPDHHTRLLGIQLCANWAVFHPAPSQEFA